MNNLKLTFIFLFILIGTMESFAQNKIGIRGGVNLSQMQWQRSGSDIEQNPRLGINVGGFYSQQLIANKLHIEPALQFALIGTNDINKISLSYLYIPVNLKYSFGKLKILSGFQVGHLLQAKESGVNTTESFINHDYGLNFGAGFDITPNVNIELCYYLGLKNVANTEVLFADSEI